LNAVVGDNRRALDEWAKGLTACFCGASNSFGRSRAPQRLMARSMPDEAGHTNQISSQIRSLKLSIFIINHKRSRIISTLENLLARNHIEIQSLSFNPPGQFGIRHRVLRRRPARHYSEKQNGPRGVRSYDRDRSRINQSWSSAFGATGTLKIASSCKRPQPRTLGLSLRTFHTKKITKNNKRLCELAHTLFARTHPKLLNGGHLHRRPTCER
jgi:hypothetical protein